MAGKRIVMGVIGRPHGVRGLLHIHSYADEDLARYALQDEQGRAWRLRWRGEGIAELLDAEARPLPDRTAAERLVNVKLYVERDQLPAAEADEFYLSDLVGMTAIGADGVELGRVEQVHDYGAGASLEIVGRVALIVPFTKACVPRIEIEAGQVTIIPPQEIELPLPPEGGGGEGGRDQATSHDEQPGAPP